jgi:hypothetical protein
MTIICGHTVLPAQPAQRAPTKQAKKTNISNIAKMGIFLEK